MAPTDQIGTLLAIAAMAVTLLGFAAVATVFQPVHTHPSPGGSSPLARWKSDGRFWSMVCTSLFTLITALVPIPIIHGGCTPETVWGWGSGLNMTFSFASVVIACSFYHRNQRAGKPANQWLFGLLIFFYLMGTGAGFVNLLILHSPQLFLYSTGLLLMLGSAAWLFVRLMYVWLD